MDWTLLLRGLAEATAAAIQTNCPGVAMWWGILVGYFVDGSAFVEMISFRFSLSAVSGGPHS